ncbi:unnamed protein product [Caenorhabditis brenneri]
MPLVFLNFPYPARKNLVDQMSKTELLRVSLQSTQANKALQECGKNNISFYNLNPSEMQELNPFDQAELFLAEAERQGILPEWDIFLCAEVSKKFVFTLKNIDKNFRAPIEVDSIDNIDSYVGVRKNLKIRDNFVPIIITNEKKVVSFWDSKTDGLIFVLQYFAERFGMTIGYLELRNDGSPSYSDNLRSIIRACSEISIKNVFVAHGKDDQDGRKLALSADDYKFVMENLTATGTFKTVLKTSKNFKFDGVIKAKKIEIENGHWFNIKHLLEWDDYKKLEVKGKNFTVKELRMFLEKWVAGGFPKLKQLTLETKQMLDKVTDGFAQRTDIQVPVRLRTTVIRIKGPGERYATVWPGLSNPGFNMSIEYQAFE